MNRISKLLCVTPVAAVLSLGAAGAAWASSDASTSPPLSATSTPAEADAINYVNARMGSAAYDGLCL